MALNNQAILQKNHCTVVRRLTRLPIVRSAWSKLSDLYTGTKSSHPKLKVICDALEDRVIILHTMTLNSLSPVIMKLKPEISIVNDIACKSLDWLETNFPLLLAPTEEVIAITMDKMHEAQTVVGVAAICTIGCVQHAVDKVTHTDQQFSPVIERAMIEAEERLDQALNISEALVDHMLPPAEEENDEAVSSVQGCESTTLATYSVRLLTISTKLCRRTCMAIEKLSRSHCPAQRLQTLACSLSQYLHDQAVTVILFVSQMYTLILPAPPDHINSEDIRSSTGPQVYPTHKDLHKVQGQESPTWRLTRLNATDRECMSCDACSSDGYNAKCCTSP